MRLLRTLRQREGGFTVAELVVSMSLMAIMIPAVVLLLGAGAHWGKEEQEDSVIQGEARAAVDRLAADLRQAYNGDPDVFPVEAIGSTLTFVSPDRLTPFHLRRISYRLNGTVLERASWTSTNTNGPPWTYPSTAAAWHRVVPSVVAWTLVYRDGLGAVTATAANVRTVDILLRIKTTTTSKSRQFTYPVTVTLRQIQT